MIKATLKDHMGSDLTVVNAARVSFGKESQPAAWLNYDYEDGSRCGDLIAVLEPRDQKLIRYLAEHKHLSPFGHAFASFHVKAPIFVARQLVKHKFLRWNEISRRYVDEEPEFYVPDVWRGRSADKKQGSSDEFVFTESTLVRTDYDEWEGPSYREFNEIALEVYKDLLNDGVAPEQARMVLPQSTMTEWYWSGSLDAFAAMCNLRCASDTQYESRVVADQISKVLGDLFPVSWASLVPSKERSDGVPSSVSGEDL
jgi:thymidylate synthase (FAD)